MAYYISRKEYKSKLLLKLLIVALILVILLSISYTAFAKHNAGKADLSNPILEKAKQAGPALIAYKAKSDMAIGTKASSKDFEMVQVDSNLVVADCVMSLNELKNRRLARNMMRNDLLKKTDLVEEAFFFKSDDRLIEQEFSPDEIPSDCQAGSIIDIRLFKPDRSDPVVISKVYVIKREECSLSMYMDMEEQELLKQALREGKLYILLYANLNQEASNVDYSPNYTKNVLTGAE